jgi:hypothetical protein
MDDLGFSTSSEPLPAAAAAAAAADDDSGYTESVVITVDGMTCQSCVQTIQDTMRCVPGVRNIMVTVENN